MTSIKYTRITRSNRVTFTISDYVHKNLLSLSQTQGRSLSNLIAYIVENYVHQNTETTYNHESHY